MERSSALGGCGFLSAYSHLSVRVSGCRFHLACSRGKMPQTRSKSDNPSASRRKRKNEDSTTVMQAPAEPRDPESGAGTDGAGSKKCNVPITTPSQMAEPSN